VTLENCRTSLASLFKKGLTANRNPFVKRLDQKIPKWRRDQAAQRLRSRELIFGQLMFFAPEKLP